MPETADAGLITLSEGRAETAVLASPAVDGPFAPPPAPAQAGRRQRRPAGVGAGVGPVYGPSTATLASTAASSRPSWIVARPALAASGMEEPRREHENLRSSKLDEGRRAQSPRFQRSTVSSPKG